jgi:hypothetical protein
MFLSQKTPGFFAELSGHTFTVARTSSPTPPFTVEEVRTCSGDKPADITALLEELQPKRRGPGKYVHASCAVYPDSGFVRRVVLDPKRLSESGYLDEAVQTNCRVSPSEYMLAAMSAVNGVDVHQEPEKDIIFAGISIQDVNAVQKRLLGMGLFPERLELGTLSVIGGLTSYRKHGNISSPTLLLEVRDNSIQSFVVGEKGLEAARPISQGIDAMIPIVQKELGLKDEESARRLFHSNTFDFTGMASAFTKKLIKELQSSIGFYEVQTGQSIGQVLCTMVPAKLNWLQSAIATQLGVESLEISYSAWLSSLGITLSPALAADHTRGSHLLGLYSLVASHSHAAIRKDQSK